jgi:hypothetical protein
MDAPVWLSDIARDESWNPAWLPSLLVKLSELGIELEPRDGQICIKDGPCETVGKEDLPNHSAIQRLLEGERERRKHDAKQAAKAKSGAEELKRRESAIPLPPLEGLTKGLCVIRPEVHTIFSCNSQREEPCWTQQNSASTALLIFSGLAWGMPTHFPLATP